MASTEQRKAYLREWMRKYRRGENAEKARAVVRQSYVKHRDERLEALKIRRAANPELHQAALRRSYEKHKEKRAAEMKRYRQENPERISILIRSYKARRKCAEGNFTIEDIDKIFDEQCGVCPPCGVELNNTFHVDHVVPLSTGGTNWPDNLQLLCKTCNLSKGNKPMSEWLARRRAHLERA